MGIRKDARAVVDYLTGPSPAPPAPTDAVVIGTYADGGAVREFQPTDLARARVLAAGRHARSDYLASIGQPDGLLWLAVVPIDARGRCARCAPIDGVRHAPESCPRTLR